MIPEAKESYHRLIETIEILERQYPEGMSLTEHCFAAADNQWSLLKERLVGYKFISDAAEIYFFKNIKPLFTSTIEYYGLIAHAQLFEENVVDAADLKTFYQRELQRFEKFASCQSLFINYYKTGEVHQDTDWFVRCNNDGSNFSKAKSYDLCSDATTRCDYLISTYLALERYSLYLADKLQQLR